MSLYDNMGKRVAHQIAENSQRKVNLYCAQELGFKVEKHIFIT